MSQAMVGVPPIFIHVLHIKLIGINNCRNSPVSILFLFYMFISFFFFFIISYLLFYLTLFKKKIKIELQNPLIYIINMV